MYTFKVFTCTHRNAKSRLISLTVGGKLILYPGHSVITLSKISRNVFYCIFHHAWAILLEKLNRIKHDHPLKEADCKNPCRYIEGSFHIIWTNLLKVCALNGPDLLKLVIFYLYTSNRMSRIRDGACTATRPLDTEWPWMHQQSAHRS